MEDAENRCTGIVRRPAFSDQSPIIPTPAHAKYGADLALTGVDRLLRVALSPDPGVKERIALQTLRAAVTALGGSVAEVPEPGAASVVLVLLGADGAAAAGAPLDAEDLATFAQPNAAEQGYVIRPAAGASAPLYLAARDPQGLLYAAVTLTQLLRLEGGRIVARAPHIRDWPSFRYRGNNWLLWVECGRWSYERGDGAAAYAARIERKLDFTLQHKINLLIFDGFGWNPERFPGYGALVRRCATLRPGTRHQAAGRRLRGRLRRGATATTATSSATAAATRAASCTTAAASSAATARPPSASVSPTTPSPRSSRRS